MRKLVILFIVPVLLLSSCMNSSIDGKYIKTKSNDRGSLLNFGGLVSELEFKNSHCNFKYFGMPMSGKYEIDKGYIYVYVGGELGTLSLEIIDKNTLEGEGWVAGTFKKINSFKSKNKPVIGYYKTKSELNVRTGAGTNYTKIETLSKGTKVKVVSILENDWCEIEKDGYSGFVSKKYLTEE